MGDGVKDARDRALLLLGFAGGFRRSELVGVREGHQPLVLCGPLDGRSRYSEELFRRRSKAKLMLVGNAGMGQLSKRSAAI